MPKVAEGQIVDADCCEMEMSGRLFHLKEGDRALRDLWRTEILFDQVVGQTHKRWFRGTIYYYQAPTKSYEVLRVRSHVFEIESCIHHLYGYCFCKLLQSQMPV